MRRSKGRRARRPGPTIGLLYWLCVDVEKTIEFILNQAQTEAILARVAQRRPIRLGVREGRVERVRRQKANAEFEEKIIQLAAAQLETEEGLRNLSKRIDAFIESMS